MLLKTKDKWLAARALLNVILKDTHKYCANCGMPELWGAICCEDMNVGTHYDHLKTQVQINKAIKETRKNEYASTDDGSLRWGVNLPVALFTEWDLGFQRLYRERLIKPGELHQFMKEFKPFCVCERI